MIRPVGNTACLLARQLLGNQGFKRPWKQSLSNRLITSTVKDMSEKKKSSTNFGQQRKGKALAFLENMDENLKKQKLIIETEYRTLLAQNIMVPEKITEYEWYVLLTEHKTPGTRRSYFRFLYLKELAQASDEYERLQKIMSNERDLYKPQFSLSISNREKHVKQSVGVRSMLLGNPIIFDLDYDMSQHEAAIAIRQMITCYGINLRHPDPFHIYFTGYESCNERFSGDGKLSGGFLSNLFVDCYPNSFMDLFPKERLVYLSPDGPMLDEYCGDDIYVIGGHVDLPVKKQTSLAKSRELGIRCGSLPIHRYFRKNIVTGRTLLTLNCVFKTMLDVNLTHSWREAFGHNLPQHKFPLSEMMSGIEEGLFKIFQMDHERKKLFLEQYL